MRQLVVALAVVFALATRVSAQEPNQPTNPPLLSVPWSTLNPDMAGLVSTDRSAGATLVTLHWPTMVAPTSDFVLRVSSVHGGQVDFHGIVQKDSTYASIAKDLCDQINANASQKAANVGCQLNNPGISTFFGVSHFNDNPLTVSGLTGYPIMQVFNGSLAWDAGPFLFLNRAPPGGVVPPPGSNCGQISYGAPNSQTPSVASTSYTLLSCTVDNPDANNLASSWSIYTAQTWNGAPLLGPRMVFSTNGMTTCIGYGQCAASMGPGTLSFPQINGALVLGSRAVCVNPTTQQLYLALGSACP
jgi:hypothetical protein